MLLEEIPLQDIEVLDRFRKDYGDMLDLESIRDKGVIQPITVYWSSTINKYVLMAGGRRVAKCRELHLDTIPALVRKFDGDADAREIELFENIHRKELTWQERAALELEIKRLKGATVRGLADETEQSKSAVARHVALGEAMEVIPELREYKTEDEAWKALHKIQEAVVIKELAKRAEAEEEAALAENSDAPELRAYRAAKACYRLGDAIDGLSDLGPMTMDFAEVDPPYGIDLVSAKRRETNTNLPIDQYTEVPVQSYYDFVEEVAHNVKVVLKEDAFCLWWFGPSNYQKVYDALIGVGFYVNPVPCIWNKGNVGQTQQPDYNLANCWEPFFVVRKGKPVLARPGRSNVFTFNPVPGAQKIHATERPLELMLELLDTFCFPGTTMVIPFLGSGVTLRAAFHRKMTGIGWDLDKNIRNKFLLGVKEEFLG